MSFTYYDVFGEKMTRSKICDKYFIKESEFNYGRINLGLTVEQVVKKYSRVQPPPPKKKKMLKFIQCGSGAGYWDYVSED